MWRLSVAITRMRVGDACPPVRLEPALQAEVARCAQAEGLTVSQVVRKAPRQYLKRRVITAVFPIRATADPSAPISGRSGPATGKETAVPSGARTIIMPVIR